MVAHLYGDDPEPDEPCPAGMLLVPVRSGPAGFVARVFRTPLGERTAVGFTTRTRLAATLGPDQAWLPLSEAALRDLTVPLGVATLTVDPQFAASPVTPVPAPAPWPAHGTRPAGALRAHAA
ncbi:SAV_915 family protein [Streptacidiphilus sp. EB129]|uniref:SAV_915 family protein n=1 Tax=Streptacidiphilus sp. EB129 TaxID=3156262 RepID=UPI00351571D9